MQERGMPGVSSCAAYLDAARCTDNNIDSPAEGALLGGHGCTPVHTHGLELHCFAQILKVRAHLRRTTPQSVVSSGNTLHSAREGVRLQSQVSATAMGLSIEKSWELELPSTVGIQ